MGRIETFVGNNAKCCRGDYAPNQLRKDAGKLTNEELSSANTILHYLHESYVDQFVSDLRTAATLFVPDFEFEQEQDFYPILHTTRITANLFHSGDVAARVIFTLQGDAGLSLCIQGIDDDTNVGQEFIVANSDEADTFLKETLRVAGAELTDKPITLAQLSLLVAHIVIKSMASTSIADFKSVFVPDTDSRFEYLVWDDREYEDGVTFAEEIAYNQYIAGNYAPNGISETAHMSSVDMLVKAADTLFDINAEVPDITEAVKSLTPYINRLRDSKKPVALVSDMYACDTYVGSRYAELVAPNLDRVNVDNCAAWTGAAMTLITALQDTKTERELNKDL
jgi:hypothetical protein